MAPSKTEQCYVLLKERIMSGVYGPGYRLVIDQVARETGVSVIPVRESIRKLEAEGWLEVIPHVGARVATFDTNAYTQTMQILARLEGYATALAALRLTDEQRRRARTINQEMAQALEDFDPVRFSNLNRQFHLEICINCGDDYLISVLTAQWNRLDLIRRSAFSNVPTRARASVVEHEALLELLDHPSESEAIEAAARQHKLNVVEAVRLREAASAAVPTALVQQA